MKKTFFAGIDLGGTKIESALFDSDFNTLNMRSVPAPKENYSILLDGLVDQINWLKSQTDFDFPLGVGIPGYVNPDNGLANTVNLPINQKNLAEDLQTKTGKKTCIANDIDCFALSEAQIKNQDYCYGIMFGTGIGGSLFRAKQNPVFLAAPAGEIGHLPISANLRKKLSLPKLLCSCGNHWCYEAYASGPSLQRLDKIFAETKKFADAKKRSKHMQQVWCLIATEIITLIHIAARPDCFFLGGGVLKIPGKFEQLHQHLENTQIFKLPPPIIYKAKYPHSCCRGAALLPTI